MRENLFGLADKKWTASYLISCWGSWDSVARRKRIDLKTELLKASAYLTTKPDKYSDFPAFYRNWINKAEGQEKDPYHKDEPTGWTMKIDGRGYFGGSGGPQKMRGGATPGRGEEIGL